jgi:hypothetical protein
MTTRRYANKPFVMVTEKECAYQFDYLIKRFGVAFANAFDLLIEGQHEYMVADCSSPDRARDRAPVIYFAHDFTQLRNVIRQMLAAELEKIEWHLMVRLRSPVDFVIQNALPRGAIVSYQTDALPIHRYPGRPKTVTRAQAAAMPKFFITGVDGVMRDVSTQPTPPRHHPWWIKP